MKALSGTIEDDAAPRVLMSPGPGDAMPNPYNRLLVESISSGASVRPFTWRSALFARYDVLHLHWPEALIFSTSRLRANLKISLLRLLMIRLRLSSSVVVWTVHNELPHEEVPHRAARALDAMTSATSARIHLNRTSAVSDAFISRKGRDVVIPHGTYPGGDPGMVAPQEGALLFFGSIRPYKGIDRLLAAFRDVHAVARLRVIGQASDRVLADRLKNLASADERVSLSFRYFDDCDLDEEIAHAAGVVLPYSAMTNSGVALLALSRDRPILAPAVPAILELQEEVGADWVSTFEGAVSGNDLEEFLVTLRSPRAASPDLQGRDWEAIAALHLRLYHELIRDAA
ncbi:hypothetical protein QUG92_13750 [Curtobacterium sp. RHCKG23]|uniref:Uncharacterized protein n=1 Tax=Curtobacterium citri TaxID=3055139 RepID=A0ABT7TB54_9MICO|nr:hypothetical protein [Curtobacterium citri]MDM7886172.1 hypothetical protein [Curtobacterium citri]